MKTVFKIFIPILLALAIIACLGWYLFVYDRDFTRDVLLSGARYCDRNGHTTLSGWFYDRAYDMAKDNDSVAIELAMQHRADGNYTQAENTLSKAIEDGGGADLYTALCKVYIEQDKILDAVKLLDGITNPETKAVLDSLRPVAPAASPEPGFYNQYISVTVTGEGGTLYVNPIAEYPSVKDAPYAEPVVLHDGENTIYAVTVAESGLVSPLSILNYTVGGIIEQVQFQDAAVEKTVRELLSLPEGTSVMSNQLWDITSFTVPQDTETLADLKYMLFLEELVMDDAPSGELAVLEKLTHLTDLSITNTNVTSAELAVIGSLPELTRLTLNGCGLSAAAALEPLTKLTYLDLGNNTIRNIDALVGMKHLLELHLQQNALIDLSSLSGLTKLTNLDVSGNSLTDLSPLLGLSALEHLDASTNQIASVQEFDILAKLAYLDLSENQLTDLTPLAGIYYLKELNVSQNLLTDISCLSALRKLEVLNFAHNQVKAIPSFEKDCALITIDGSYNLVESLKPLAGLTSLNNIFMDYNEEISTLEWLADNHVLIQVNVYGTKVNGLDQVSLLTEHDIIVNFTPKQDD